MFIAPKSDTCMKELFRNKTVLKYFISAVLAIPPEEIRTVYLKNTFLWKRHRNQKQGILDVLAEMNDNAKINIELQVKHYASWDRRQLFYLAKMYTEDLKIGEDYSLLKKCVAVSILDFNLTNRKEYHHIYRLRDDRGYEFSDILEIHVLELKKNLEKDGDIEDWIRFFRVESEEDLNMLNTKNPGILEAIREVRTMSLSRRLRLHYEAYLKQVRDEKAWKKYEREEARNEGLAEGREAGLAEGREAGLAEGRAEGQAKIIRHMLRQKISDQDIIKLSGCSQDELKRIKENASDVSKSV